LGKWDEARGVERDDVYRGFLLPQKLKLLRDFQGIKHTTNENDNHYEAERGVAVGNPSLRQKICKINVCTQQ